MMAVSPCVFACLVWCVVRVHGTIPLIFPKIVHCTYINDTSDCHVNLTTNSTFAFGDPSQNVFFIDRFRYNLKLKCIAPYPIRWVTEQPLFQRYIFYIPENDTEIQLENPLTKAFPAHFRQTLFLKRFKVLYEHHWESKTFRCESLETPTLTSEIFVHPTKTYLRRDDLSYEDTKRPFLHFRGSDKVDGTSFFIVKHPEEDVQTNQSGFTIPCAAEDFYGNFTTKLLRSNRQLMVTSNQIPYTVCVLRLVTNERRQIDDTRKIYTVQTDGCAECYCVAKTICTEVGFCLDDSSSTNPFSCGSTSSDTQDTFRCLSQEVPRRIQKTGDNVSCGHDTLLVWNNATHGLSVDCHARLQCYKPDPEPSWVKDPLWNRKLFEKVYENCLIQREMKGFKYDLRVGYRVTQPPDFGDVYQCLSLNKDHSMQSRFMAAIDSGQKIKASLEYNPSGVGNQGLGCYTQHSQPNLQLVVAPCDSLVECELGWKTFASDPFMDKSGSFTAKKIKLNQTYPRHELKYQRGFLYCWGILHSLSQENDPNSVKYVSEEDYFFTGIDFKHHLLSRFPIEAIIAIGMPNDFERRQIRRFGKFHTVVCKISAFLLAQNIYFAVEYDNNPNSSKLVAVGNRSISHDAVIKQITTGVEKTIGIESFQLVMRLTPNVTRISCFAPWMNHTHWARAYASLDSSFKAVDQGANSIDLPIIVYCTYSTDSDDCNAETPISNSEFEFGRHSQNVLPINRLHEYVKLTCMAPYPIRWLVQHPLVSVIHIPEVDPERLLGDQLMRPLTVHSRETILLRRFTYSTPFKLGMENTMFHCESFEDSSLSSEVYVLYKPEVFSIPGATFLSYRAIPSLNTNISYFLIQNQNVTWDQKTRFVVPCVAEVFHGNFSARLLKSDRKTKDIAAGQAMYINCKILLVWSAQEAFLAYSVLADSCIECACIANTLSLAWEFSGGDSSKSPFDCNNSSRYAHGTISCLKDEASRRIQNDSNYRNCGNHTLLIWDNITHAISVDWTTAAGKHCHKAEWKEFEALGKNLWSTELSSKVYNHCLRKRVVKNAQYDPRVGFLVTQPSGYGSAYQCFSIGENRNLLSSLMVPLDTRQKIKASLEYSDNDSADGGINCYTEAGENSLVLVVANCSSLIECELNWKPSTSDSFPVEPYLNDGRIDLIHLNTTNSSHKPKSPNGYVHCWQIVYPPAYENGSYSLKYVSEEDYFFTGTDLKQHLLSRSATEKFITIVHHSEQRKSGKNDSAYVVVCKFSTFALRKNIYFAVESDHNSTFSKLIVVGNKSSDDATSKRVTTRNEEMFGIESVQLELRFTPYASKVSCYAPWRNSIKWAQADVNVASELKDGDSTRHSAIVVTSVTVTGLLVSGGIVLLVWNKYRAALTDLRELTEDDVDEFHFGNNQRHPNADEIVDPNTIPFDTSLVISRDSLQIGSEIIGMGQFGIVHNGTLEDHPVAVKLCKPNVGIERFKEFLKEVKVMGYVGVHENIVHFHGAVVDRIRENICYAVMELSPLGNLHTFLRNNGDKYSDATMTMPNRCTNDPSFEMQNCVGLYQPLLVCFCKQIAAGMKFLSLKKVIHGDLACRNVLVFENNVVKISDFGLSRKLYNYKIYIKQKRASLPWRWMALESLRYLEFSSKSDVWSFGVTVWEIFSFAEVPFSGERWSTDFANQIEAGLRLSKPRVAPQNVFEFINKCWDKHQDSRPEFTECEEFFENLECIVRVDDTINESSQV